MASALVEVGEEEVGQRLQVVGRVAHAPESGSYSEITRSSTAFSSNFVKRVVAYTCDATRANVKARTGQKGATLGQRRSDWLGTGLRVGTHRVGVSGLMCSLSCTCHAQGINPRGCRVRVLVQGARDALGAGTWAVRWRTPHRHADGGPRRRAHSFTRASRTELGGLERTFLFSFRASSRAGVANLGCYIDGSRCAARSGKTERTHNVF